MDSVFTFLNAEALLGWSAVLSLLLLQSTNSLTSWTASFFNSNNDSILSIISLLLFLEVICFIEVGRIAMGQLKGNLILGVVLHMIRMTCLLLVLPDGLSSSDDHQKYTSCILVLYSWSLTEVGRYPMYLFPTSSIARYIRLVLPIFTFPVGAAAEAFGAYTVLTEIMRKGIIGNGLPVVYWVKVGLLGMVIFINGLLGPTLAYPALLKKGFPVLMGRKAENNKRTKTA